MIYPMIYPKGKPARQDFIDVEEKTEQLEDFTRSFIVQLRNRLLQIGYDEESNIRARMPTYRWAIPWEATHPDSIHYRSDIDAMDIEFTKTYRGEPDNEYLLIPFAAIETKNIDEALGIYLDFCEEEYRKYLKSQEDIKNNLAKVQEDHDRKLYQQLKERFEPTAQQETHHG